MYLKPGSLAALEQLLPGWSEGLQATHALLVCSAAFVFYTLSRLLAAHAAEAVLEEVIRLASSPVEGAALVALGLWLLSHSAGYSRVLQLLAGWNQLKLHLAILAVSTTTSIATPQAACAAPLPPPAAHGSPWNTGSGGSSPRKDLTSHRLSERRARTAKHKHRWSFDVAPSSGPRREFVPRQRGGSVDSRTPASPRTPSPPTASLPDTPRSCPPPVGATPPQPHAAAAEAAVPGTAPPSTSRRREPLMPRIASGQQLMDLHMPRRSIDNTRPHPAAVPRPAAAAAAGLPIASLSARAVAESAARVHPPSNILSAAHPPAAGHAPEATQRLPAVAPRPGKSPFAAEPSSGAAPTSPTKAALAVTSWVYSRTAVLSSWASTTVDSVLRPLIPGANARPAEPLLRTHSAPAPTPGAAAAQGEGGAAPFLRSRLSSELQRRRSSLDGGGRFYTQGAVVAAPARQGKLEQYARAARLQACSFYSYGGAPAVGASPLQAGVAGAPTSPGHVLLANAGLAPLGAGAGRSTVASVGLDGDCPQEIREVVSDEHLVQFGTVLGEEAALKVSSDLGLPEPWGAQGSLYGAFGEKESGAEDWEQIVCEAKPGLQYIAWRKPLRGGLFVYRSSAKVAGVSPKELRSFHLDDESRPSWDDTILQIERIQPPSAPHPCRNGEWCLHRFRSRFPRPMAARVYNYARRVWHRPADGGCYMICRSTQLPPGEGPVARAVQVDDYVSCCAIRAAEGGAELVTVYFEDSQVRPGLAKMAVPKGLWPFMLKYEAALRSACMERAEGCRRRLSLDTSEGPAPRPREAGPAAGGRHLMPGRPLVWGVAAARARQAAAVEAQGGKRKWVRNLVLATGINIMYHLMKKG